MFQQHPNFKAPRDPHVTIWRYFDFTKFVSLLEKQALFFTRADKFDDPFEGKSPEAEIEYMAKLVSDRTGEDINDTMARVRKTEEHQRTNMAISCWHKNPYESLAMWKVYLKSNEGVAIKSNYVRLKNSFDVYQEKAIWIGEVTYEDYSALSWQNKLFYNFTHKRPYFSFENEVRAFLFRFHRSLGTTALQFSEYAFYQLHGFDQGNYVATDLGILIENIVVAPDSPVWFFELVQSTTERYGLDKSLVIRSSLDR